MVFLSRCKDTSRFQVMVSASLQMNMSPGHRQRGGKENVDERRALPSHMVQQPKHGHSKLGVPRGHGCSL